MLTALSELNSLYMMTILTKNTHTHTHFYKILGQGEIERSN